MTGEKYSKLTNKILSLDCELISFDIFETVVTRTYADPSGIFLRIDSMLKTDSKFKNYPQFIKENFYYLRQTAEKSARTVYPNIEHPPLELIYEMVNSSKTLTTIQIGELIDLEKNIEIDNCWGVGSVIDSILELKKLHKNVIFLTDMYLDRNTITAILHKSNPLLVEIPMYISSECNASKSKGNIFEKIYGEYNIPYDKWVHLGNSYKNDVKSPQRYGIKVHQIKYMQLMDHEKYLLCHNRDSIEIQTSIGISRNCRHIKGKRESAYDVGSSFGGPMLYPYVKWVIEESMKLGVKQLNLISRDGYVLKKIADEIIKANDFPISTNYFCSSRIVIRRLTSNGDISYLFKGARPPRNSIQLSKTIGFNVNLDIKESTTLEDLTGTLLSNKELCSKYKKYVDDERELFIEYLRQNTLENFAFVDLDGSGQTLHNICKIYNKYICKKPIPCFYILCKGKASSCFDLRVWSPQNFYCATVLELFCRAPHGQVIGYEKKRNIIRPIFEKDCGESYLKTIKYDKYIQGVIDYSK